MLLLFLVFQIWVFGVVGLWFRAQTERGRQTVLAIGIFLLVMGLAAAQVDRDALRAALGSLR